MLFQTQVNLCKSPCKQRGAFLAVGQQSLWRAQTQNAVSVNKIQTFQQYHLATGYRLQASSDCDGEILEGLNVWRDRIQMQVLLTFRSKAWDNVHPSIYGKVYNTCHIYIYNSICLEPCDDPWKPIRWRWRWSFTQHIPMGHLLGFPGHGKFEAFPGE